MQWYKHAFGWLKSGVKFPKWHDSVHYVEFIHEYGAPDLIYGGWWEKAHRFLVRLPWLRTGRNLKNMHELMLLRCALADIVRQKKAIFEGIEAEWGVLEYVWVKGEAGEKGYWSLREKHRGEDEDEEGDTASEAVCGWDKTGSVAVNGRCVCVSQSPRNA